MARLVGVYAASHAPLIVRAREDVDPARRDALDRSFAELGRRLAAARPDLLVVFSPDHWVNFFIDNLPSVCIGVGETHAGPPEAWLRGSPFDTIAGHAAFGLHLARTALGRGAEPSLSYHLELDHGFVIPLWKMGLVPPPPVVPVVVNTIEPPMPTPERCLAWGALLREAIETYPEDLRVAVLASGGLSHSIGEADMGRIDEAFDRECLARLASDEDAALLDFLARRLEAAGNGAAEVRCWMAARGAAGNRAFELIGYHPYPEWYVGCAYGAWHLDPAA